MTLGKLFFVLAALLLFLAGIGATFVPNPQLWALFCIALGLLLGDYSLGWQRR